MYNTYFFLCVSANFSLFAIHLSLFFVSLPQRNGNLVADAATM